MKKLFTSIIVLLVINNIVFGTESLIKNKKDSQALLFTLQGLSQFGSNGYNGGLGYQYYIFDNLAIRIGFGLNIENNKEFDSNSNNLNIYKEYDLYDINIEIGIKYNFISSTTIMGFIGFEVLYSYQNKRNQYFNYELNKPKLEEIYLNYGSGIFLGIEWFAWENVSLGAEYKIKFQIEKGFKTIKDYNLEEKINLPQITKINFGQGKFNFILAFYIY